MYMCAPVNELIRHIRPEQREAIVQQASNNKKKPLNEQ